MERHPGTAFDAEVVIAGAGPVGLALALLLAQRDVSVTVVDCRTNPSQEGSKAINLAAHALRVLDAVGAAAPLLAEGVALSSARTYYRSRELFAREIREPGPGCMPAFINVSQSETADALLARVRRSSRIHLRWDTEVRTVTQSNASVQVGVRDGVGRPSVLSCQYVVGCDGGRSTVRALIGSDFLGRSYDDRFLIADIKAQLPFPNERRFFFDPPTNPGRQVLIHPQPRDVWRIDWQVPGDVDLEHERTTGAIDARVRSIVGDTPYTIEWLSLYRFEQRVASQLRAGRVLLAGDAAHVMSPFGGRGLNSGLEDVANLSWKLAAVLDGRARPGLLDSYASERRHAAIENLRVTGATMRFMVPEGRRRRARRDLILAASAWLPWARGYVNSGHLAAPARYGPSAAVIPAHTDRPLPEPGTYAPDVPCRLAPSPADRGLQSLRGDRCIVMIVMPTGKRSRSAMPWDAVDIQSSIGLVDDIASGALRTLADPYGEVCARYGADGLCVGYLLRPDGYVAARATATDASQVWKALADHWRQLECAVAGVARDAGTGATSSPDRRLGPRNRDHVAQAVSEPTATTTENASNEEPPGRTTREPSEGADP